MDKLDKKAALMKLLDDPSPSVQKAVCGQLKNLKEEGMSLLSHAISESDPVIAGYAQYYLQELFGDVYIQRFSNFVRSLNYELETGFLMLDQTVYPGMNVNSFFSFLDEISSRCCELALELASTKERLKVINRVIFHEYSFVGDNDNFFNPQNSFLHQVIERRRGIPITLSVLYILIAQRCGLKLDPVRISGRIMVGCYADERPFYIDPFEKGMFRFEEDIHEILTKQVIENGYVGPISVGDLLSQNCRNLVQQYAAVKNEKLSDMFRDFVHEFERVAERV